MFGPYVGLLNELSIISEDAVILKIYLKLTSYQPCKDPCTVDCPSLDLCTEMLLTETHQS